MGATENAAASAEADLHVAPAGKEHFAALRAVELAAFETLRRAGAVSGEPAASSALELQAYLDAGFLVAAFAGAKPVGYAGGTLLEGRLHVGEMDVHPDWQRRGIGRRLMQALLAQAMSRGLCGASLTTDRLAPFNAPFYANLGFRMVEGAAVPERLGQILDSERLKGLDPARRCAMLLDFAG
ncbi:GNAT family N-acetyltransferase [Rhizobium straminoryzae]|uniref:GNAT family N-acetyltransferase n=1 Tax=Rhizobium straminoryzae TaxID=1387186 RepID=A0A549TGH1_9HYPH|nr:GNAT family N-acetyltransferase [Rhizobium straminoryzae]TRL41878.1 GNAT family N-acetyltransferase [Rhizobium straminoryzae]